MVLRLLSRFAWVVVGGLFIFSGLIKLNDPVGTAIKLEEYFEVFSVDFSSVFLSLKPFALYLSIFLSTLEVVLGVALLVRWKLNTVLWLLFVLILFFTSLTFYSAYFNKVTDCGCFGDAIKLTPWESFTKDIILLVLILLLLFTQRQLLSLGQINRGVTGAIVLVSLIFSLTISVYAYRNEPFLDFRAYRVGANIPKLMKPSAPLRYQYVMVKNGQETTFANYPTDTTYKFKQMVPLNPEDGPKITDFNIWNDQGDFTQEMFLGNRLLILVKDVNKADHESFKEINALLAGLEKDQSPKVVPVVITSSSSQEFDVFRHEVNLSAPYFFADATVLKTMIRSNPGLLLFKNGVVVGKWHYNNTPTLQEVQEKVQ
ncbi:BT_3928 family protein [Rufibacter latericius]|uniref:DoxX family protein n=1 Tax=Rufibacter latericius TaxID=2487040 RepID=A0A3M9MTG7_9BACT|nr:BT_3928 family protein [Rufibacter latericius]RNI28789.1 DoxX family protein [Rufibacter latericius]